MASLVFYISGMYLKKTILFSMFCSLCCASFAQPNDCGLTFTAPGSDIMDINNAGCVITFNGTGTFNITNFFTYGGASDVTFSVGPGVTINFTNPLQIASGIALTLDGDGDATAGNGMTLSGTLIANVNFNVAGTINMNESAAIMDGTGVFTGTFTNVNGNATLWGQTYDERGGSGAFDCSSGCNETILPVELISFDANTNSQQVGINLTWSTASELNNSHFTIERSYHNSPFQLIEKVNGHGTTNQQITYSYFDNPTKTGLYYYRLTQYDYDGKSTNLGIVNSQYENNKSREIHLSPTIVDDSRVTLFPVHSNEINQLNLTSIDGITQVRVYPTSFSFEKAEIQIPPSVENGIYILHGRINNQEFRQKIVMKK